MKKISVVMIAMAATIMGCSDTTLDTSPYIEFDNAVIVESLANDGTFTGTINIKSVGVDFNDGLVANDDYEFSDVPSGITPVFTRVDDNHATLSIDGQIGNHGRCDVQSIGLNLLKSAFKTNTRPVNASALIWLAYLPATYSVASNVLNEDAGNPGKIDNNPPATLTLGNAGSFAFSGLLQPNVHYVILPQGVIPAGLQEELVVSADGQTLEVSLTGTVTPGDTATNHQAANSFNFNINFLKTKISENAAGTTISPFAQNAFCAGQEPVMSVAVNFVD